MPPGAPILVGFALPVAVTCGHGRLSGRLVAEVVLVALESMAFDCRENTCPKPFIGLVRISVGHLVVFMNVLSEPMMTLDLL